MVGREDLQLLRRNQSRLQEVRQITQEIRRRGQIASPGKPRPVTTFHKLLECWVLAKPDPTKATNHISTCKGHQDHNSAPKQNALI